MEFHLSTTKEIVIIGEKGNELERELQRRYLPNSVVVLSSDAETDSNVIPLRKDRVMIEGKPTAYVCEDFICNRPVTTVAEIIEAIK